MLPHDSDGITGLKRPLDGVFSNSLFPPPSKRARGQPPPWMSPATSDASRQSSPTPQPHITASDSDVPMVDVDLRPEPTEIIDRDPIICFGAIGRLPSRKAQNEEWECLAKIDPAFPTSSPLRKSRDEFIVVSARSEPGHPAHYTLYTAENDKVATLDRVTGSRLRSLQSLRSLQFQVLFRTASIKKLPKSPFPVSVNILGPESVAARGGEKLGEMQAYLQHPYLLDRGTEYLNPQHYRTASDGRYMTHLVGITEEDNDAKVLCEEIEGVMNSLALENLSAATTYGDIVTVLKEHQRHGVDFIRRREDLDYCRRSDMHVRLITCARQPRPGRIYNLNDGGILADTMGMGKTLTTITAITASRLDAREFVASPDRASGKSFHGPTLIVVPSVQLMDVWQTEVKRHVKPGCLLVSEFHGSKGARTPEQLLRTQSDVILTTYSTLVEDLKKGQKASVLQRVAWYRVVLDEAHWIRNQSSKRFRAAKALNSQRRWCLTGTPIQNSLEDIASLISFLNVQPFAKREGFRDLILKPLKEGEIGRCNNLKALLASICLRRGSSRLNLLNVSEEQVDVEWTMEEQLERTRALDECRQRMETFVSRGGGRSGAPKYNIMFAAMMRMRLICNNGTFRGTDRLKASVDPASTAAIENPDSGPCEECNDLEMTSSEESFCSMCGRQVRVDPGVESAPVSQSPLSGHSSKLERLVDKIQGYPAGDKSIVFTAWTSTLDIIQHLLELRGIGFRRIDGGVLASDRAGKIQEFSDDPQIPVIIMTVGTGAVGLTITAANKVHLVEPQWNPFLEEQAIARAVRMGQKREVTVVRYVVKGSVEKNIMDLQKKKSSLAKFTVGDEGDKMSGKLEDLRFILEM